MGVRTMMWEVYFKEFLEHPQISADLRGANGERLGRAAVRMQEAETISQRKNELLVSYLDSEEKKNQCVPDHLPSKC